MPLFVAAKLFKKSTDEGGGGGTVIDTTVTLTVANWVENSQTVSVNGVTADNTVTVSPAPASVDDYVNAGVLCTAQSTDSLTFTCVEIPTNDITVNVVIM